MPRTSPHADDHDDELVHPVAALERTALAWERTGIGLGAVGALLLHLGEGSSALLLLGIVMLLAAFVVVLVLAPTRYRAARAGVVARDRRQGHETSPAVAPVPAAGPVSAAAPVPAAATVIRPWIPLMLSLGIAVVAALAAAALLLP